MSRKLYKLCKVGDEIECKDGSYITLMGDHAMIQKRIGNFISPHGEKVPISEYVNALNHINIETLVKHGKVFSFRNYYDHDIHGYCGRSFGGYYIEYGGDDPKHVRIRRTDGYEGESEMELNLKQFLIFLDVIDDVPTDFLNNFLIDSDENMYDEDIPDYSGYE